MGALAAARWALPNPLMSVSLSFQEESEGRPAALRLRDVEMRRARNPLRRRLLSCHAADMSSSVVAIHIGGKESGPLTSVTSVRAFAGKGLEGDRNFFADGADAGKALTLVEEEMVAAVGLDAGATRRQITVRGIGLNDLVGKRFHLGEVECLAAKLCEPCAHLESMTRPGLIEDL